MAPNNKNLCLSHSLSQEACIIWSLFLVPVCKMISLPEAFFIFSKFLFSRLLEVKRARNGPKWQKILVVSLSISRTVPHWYTCVKWWYIQQFFSFFQNSHFLIIFRGVRGKRAKNDPLLAISVCQTRISRRILKILTLANAFWKVVDKTSEVKFSPSDSFR